MGRKEGMVEEKGSLLYGSLGVSLLKMGQVTLLLSAHMSCSFNEYTC